MDQSLRLWTLLSEKVPTSFACLLAERVNCILIHEAVIQRVAKMGIPVVCAVGNASSHDTGDQFPPDIPANCTGAISVAAVDSNNKIANFSNIDESVVVACTGIVGAVGNDFFRQVHGTSYSAAIVAGVISLMFCEKRSLTVSRIGEILDSAGPFVFGSGRSKPLRSLDAYRAIRAAGQTIEFNHTSTFSAAMNASCGMSTLPNWRMRFLPSFCLSSSLRLRVASPP